MAEVSAIVNSRPLVPVSTDPENPLILTPAMLLTQKTDYVFTSDHLGEFDKRDLCLAEWRRVQALASVFCPVGGRNTCRYYNNDENGPKIAVISSKETSFF
ncbi:Hypothetical predicted protein [Mytilus galloprovincialis]|uniref:Uncharacterized protein n=1 Tax=Mytilus galloprovincialis TaxID=29158 RepID=A0A8B6GRY0_MYTGA|nr:Hypothetical predicted protein [Mytilus galloprovincialis]